MEALTKTNNKSDITHYTHPEFDVTLVKICRCHFVPKPKGYILYDGCKKTFSPMILNLQMNGTCLSSKDLNGMNSLLTLQNTLMNRKKMLLS